MQSLTMVVVFLSHDHTARALQRSFLLRARGRGGGEGRVKGGEAYAQRVSRAQT